MKNGLLWFDDNPKRSLADKVERASEKYQRRFGCLPTLCYVHSTTVAQSAPGAPPAVRVLIARHVLPGHLWIGQSSDDGSDTPSNASDDSPPASP